jgi:hypothetical protein
LPKTAANRAPDRVVRYDETFADRALEDRGLAPTQSHSYTYQRPFGAMTNLPPSRETVNDKPC